MAANYTRVNWDTTKYVNPTNMNQMDKGIKDCADGVMKNEADISAINTNLTWKTVGTVTGATVLSLPSEFEEIMVITTNTTGNGCFIKKINKRALIDSVRQFYDGMFLNSGNNAVINWLVSLSKLNVNFVNWGASSILETATTTVYYR